MPRPLPTAVASPIADLLPFANVKLVVADLDGTLIGSDGVVWGKTRHMFKRMARYKVRFTVATGRTLAGAQPLISNLELSTHIPVVLYNGAVIANPYSRKPLRKVTLPPECVQHILDLACQWPVNVLSYYWTTDDERFFNPHLQVPSGEVVLGWSRASTQPMVDVNGQQIIWQRHFVSPVDASPCAVLIDMQDCPDLMNDLGEKVATVAQVTITRSGGRFIEIRPPMSNKWTAVLWILDQLRIVPDEVLALGDNDNDAEMLDLAGIGVAVRNTPPRVSRLADYACSRDAASGSLQVLRMVRQARRLRPGLHPFLVGKPGGGQTL